MNAGSFVDDGDKSEKAQVAQRTSGLEIIFGDATRMPFPDDSFGTVIDKAHNRAVHSKVFY